MRHDNVVHTLLISDYFYGRVHFDNFAAKWDEYYNESDFKDG